MSQEAPFAEFHKAIQSTLIKRIEGWDWPEVEGVFCAFLDELKEFNSPPKIFFNIDEGEFKITPIWNIGHGDIYEPEASIGIVTALKQWASDDDELLEAVRVLVADLKKIID